MKWKHFKSNMGYGWTWLLPVILVLGTSCKNNSTGPVADAANLIGNPSFEIDNRPSYAGWHFSDSSDTAVSDDIPVLGGAWSLLMHPGWFPVPYARTYITRESGRHAYKLSVWVQTANLSSPARVAVGVLQPDRTLTKEAHANISATDWSLYSLQDTLDVVSSDTIVVELSPGAEQVVPVGAQALFDLVRLERIY